MEQSNVIIEVRITEDKETHKRRRRDYFVFREAKKKKEFLGETTKVLDQKNSLVTVKTFPLNGKEDLIAALRYNNDDHVSYELGQFAEFEFYGVDWVENMLKSAKLLARLRGAKEKYLWRKDDFDLMIHLNGFVDYYEFQVKLIKLARRYKCTYDLSLYDEEIQRDFATYAHDKDKEALEKAIEKKKQVIENLSLSLENARIKLDEMLKKLEALDSE